MIRIIDPPAMNAVPLEDFKDYMRITHDRADEALLKVLKAAQENIESKLQLRLINQRVFITCAGWAKMQGMSKIEQGQQPFIEKEFSVPAAPIQNIYAAWRITKGQEHAVDLEDIHQRALGERTRVSLKMAPMDVLKIEALVGYGPTPANVPESLKMAIKMLAQSFYYGGERLDHAALKGLLMPYIKRGVA